MASLRRVRRAFRKDALRLISSGDGNIQKLVEAAAKHFGNDVGYEVLIKTFLQTEVGNAVTFLRQEGHIETIGRQWKPVGLLAPEDATIILSRRQKRIRGELKEYERFAHKFGRFDDATTAAQMLEVSSQQNESGDVHAEQETQDVHAT